MKPTIDVFEGETKNKGYLNKCKNHAKVYNCQQCTKSFFTKQIFENHMWVQRRKAS